MNVNRDADERASLFELLLSLFEFCTKGSGKGSVQGFNEPEKIINSPAADLVDYTCRLIAEFILLLERRQMGHLCNMSAGQTKDLMHVDVCRQKLSLFLLCFGM